MSAAVLGVDAGGTKTDVLVADPDGVRARVRGAGTNHEAIGWDAARARLAELVTEALGEAGVPAQAVTASAWGLAGLDSPADEQRYRDVVAGLGLAGEVLIVNDATLVLEAAARPLAGVAVVSGTGTVAIGRTADGRTARTFGVGAGRGDWGSGGDVVRAAAVAVAEQHLGTGPATELTPLALARSGARSVPDYVLDAWRQGHHHLSPPDVWDLAAAGDAVADEIADRVARSLAAAARYVSAELELHAPVVLLAGRVLDPGHPHLHAHLARRLPEAVPGCEVRRLGLAPVAGAVLAAARVAGWPSPTVERLTTALPES